MARWRPTYPFPLAPLYPAVFLSGATALVFEIVWARRLALLLGSTAGAVAAVLSAFMLGLALGSAVVGRRADQSRRPLGWYAFLELGIGFYALAFDTLYEIAVGALPGSPWIAAFLLLVLPAALMGGTLPVLARAAADTTQRGTRALGSLYGVNTLGAVAGAAGATLLLLERFGLRGSVQIAAGCNLALGALFFALSRAAGRRTVFAAEAEAPGTAAPGGAGATVFAVFFLAGFAGLTLEVAWTRVLVYLLEGFTIAFGLMLAAYLFGLGGGALAGTWLAMKSRDPRRLVVHLLALEALLVLVTYMYSGSLVEPLEAMRSEQAGKDSIGAGYALGLFGAACAVIVPPTLFAGALLPAVARIALRDRERIGWHAGLVYAASTLGSVLAPPLAAFLFVPRFGVPGTIGAAGALLAGAAVLLAARQGRRPLVPAAAAAGLFAVLAFLADLDRPLVERSHVLAASRSPRRLLRWEEGRQAGVAVIEDLRTGVRALYVDDFRAAETGRQYGYMRMLGHLPMLLHESPERVLVIAFGTGTTAGAVAAHPEAKEIVCVEIEEQVYAVAEEFREANRSVLEDPRTQAVVADGREFVQREGEPFDVITLEPLMPYTPGAVHLYTKEFYEAARRRLSADGIVCQWIPVHAMSADDFRRLAATVTEVFEHASLWYFEQSAVVLGASKPPSIELVRFLERAGRPEVAADLRAALVGDAFHLLGAHVASGDELEAALEGAGVMTDDRTTLEFRPLPRRFGRRSTRFLAENLELLRDLHRPAIPWLSLEQPLPPLQAALESGRAALAARAEETRAVLEGAPLPPAAALVPALERDPASLYLKALQQRRAYAELLGQGLYEEAASLQLAPDRSAAFLAIAEHAEPARRKRLLKAALKDDALLPPEVLHELAESAESEEEKRFLLNRVRAQRGEPLDPGPERAPRIEVPDVGERLRQGDLDGARDALELARFSGALEAAEAEVWRFWQEAEDKSAALRLVHGAGSGRALEAALQLYARGTRADLIGAAPVLCQHYPRGDQWARLCRHAAAEVRSAAAEAAALYGSDAHLPLLLELCADPDEDVRLSAFVAFRRFRADADRAGYDPGDPTETGLSALRRLAESR